MRTSSLFLLFASGCLDPLTSDEVPMRDVLPAGEEGPWVSGEIAEQIDEYDGVDGDLVQRLSGFAKGDRVWYWDFGPTVEFTAPLWRIVDSDGPIGAPVWDVVPGDPGYSPFWAVNLVRTTDKYAGEVITSRQGIDDAIRAGLLTEPEPQGVYINCPVVARGTRIEVGGGEEPNEAHWAYYRGVKVAYFDFDESHPDVHLPTLGSEIPVGSLYVLSRVSESEPLREPTRQVDMTGDGDTNDTNDIFDLYLEDGDEYTPAWQLVGVTIPATAASIDTNRDETLSDFLTERRLFEVDDDGTRTPAINPDTGAPYIVGYDESQILVNCPHQTAPGQI